jgi:hypothetical protein
MEQPLSPEPLEIIRALDATPGGSRIFELSDGRFAFRGEDATAELEGELPSDAARAPYEAIVYIPRAALIDAARHIPRDDGLLRAITRKLFVIL